MKKEIVSLMAAASVSAYGQVLASPLESFYSYRSAPASSSLTITHPLLARREEELLPNPFDRGQSAMPPQLLEKPSFEKLRKSERLRLGTLHGAHSYRPGIHYRYNRRRS